MNLAAEPHNGVLHITSTDRKPNAMSVMMVIELRGRRMCT